LEKNIRKFEEDQDANVKYIQNLMKLEVEKERLKSLKEVQDEKGIKKSNLMISKDDLGTIEESINAELDESRIKIPRDQALEESVFIDNNQLANQITLATKKGFALNLTRAPDLKETEINFNPRTLVSFNSRSDIGAKVLIDQLNSKGGE